MLLIVYHVAFMITGDLSAYLIGLIVERAFGSYASLIAFLALYFSILLARLGACGSDDGAEARRARAVKREAEEVPGPLTAKASSNTSPASRTTRLHSPPTAHWHTLHLAAGCASD